MSSSPGDTPPRVVAAAEIDLALDPAALADALAEAFADGRYEAPARYHDAVPGPGTLLLMPAWGGAYLGLKAVSVFPGNGARGLPSVQGTYLLLDGATGRPLAVLDGTRLTLWRTAAASALAARHLARPDAARMVMVGAGALAPFLVRAHAAARPLREVLIWARRAEAAREVAAVLAGEGLPAAATPDLEAAVREADLVSCATLATAPLVRGAWLRAGAHLDLVGAFAPGMREVDDAALRRAALFVDTPAALSEGGDVGDALAAGTIGRQDVRGDLADLCRGAAPGRGDPSIGPEGVTLFKSVGAAVEDLAAAILVWRALAPAS